MVEWWLDTPTNIKECWKIYCGSGKKNKTYSDVESETKQKVENFYVTLAC